MNSHTTALELSYLCPRCRTPLAAADHSLACAACGHVVRAAGGIPDFLASADVNAIAPNHRWIRTMEFLAPVYEGRTWHNFILKTLADARHSTLQTIVDFIAESLAGVEGNILDAACGPATHGRRLASPARRVYGIDFSVGTLQQGMRNIARDGVRNIHLSRNSVEQLPFADSFFDGAICGGALHLFPDTAAALKEIARTMKPGAPLAVTTFAIGDAPLTSMLRRRRNMHVFTQDQLQQLLANAGFESYRSTLDGTFLCFIVRRSA